MVPSLSKTATRSASGTNASDPSVVTASTKSTIACFAGVSFQLGSASDISVLILRMGDGRPASRRVQHAAVLDDVRHDQREGKEEQAQREIAEPAVALAAGNAGRPERDRDPDDQPDDADAEPTRSRHCKHVLAP